MSTSVKVICPRCGYRYLLTPLPPQGKQRLFAAEITDANAPLVCPACNYEGPLPEDAKLILLGAPRLEGVK